MERWTSRFKSASSAAIVPMFRIQTLVQIQHAPPPGQRANDRQPQCQVVIVYEVRKHLRSVSMKRH